MNDYQDPVEMLALEMRDRLAAASAEYDAMRQRAEAAEARIKELEAPALTALATQIDLIQDYAAYYAEVTARGDAPEAFVEWFTERDCATVMEQRENLRRRAEAAEAKLTDVDNYGVEQWNRGLSEGDNGDCQTFQEWLQSR